MYKITYILFTFLFITYLPRADNQILFHKKKKKKIGGGGGGHIWGEVHTKVAADFCRVLTDPCLVPSVQFDG